MEGSSERQNAVITPCREVLLMTTSPLNLVAGIKSINQSISQSVNQSSLGAWWICFKRGDASWTEGARQVAKNSMLR